MLLVSTLPKLVASLACFTRIQTFLLAASRQDHRLLLSQPQASYGNLEMERGDSFPLQSMAQTNANSGKQTGEYVFMLKGCSFGWTVDKPLVHNVDLNIKRGALCMMIGPTGCGKSTLIKGLLGETPCSTGFVYLDTDSISFADQEPWTINSTIKSGIIGESQFDESFYREVVECCALREDIESWPQGELTIVGSKGISLSGGQKSRLALARAVFARKGVIVLDDVFSGLDADTEEHIFRKLFSESGLLRRHHTTVILVTHAVARLSYADWIVVLNKDGLLTEQGTYAKLKKDSEYINSLAVRFKTANASQVDQSVKVTKSALPSTTATTAEATNMLARNTGDWDTYKHYFAAAGWSSAISLAVWSFIYIASIKTPALLVKYFTGPGKTTNSNDTFMAIMGSVAVLSLFSLATIVWINSFKLIPRASNNLHQRLLTTVLGAPLSFFTSTDSGTTLNRFSQDLNLIDNELPHVLLATVLQLALFLIGGGLMAATATYSLAMIPVVIFVLFAVQRFYLRTSRQLRHLELEANAPLYTHFQETLAGLSSIRVFGWVNQFSSRNSDLLDRSQRPVYLLKCIQCWLAVVLDLLVAVVATTLMAVIVSLRHKIDPGLVGLGLLNIMSFNEILSYMIQMWTMTETSIGAIARVRDFVTKTQSEAKSIESFTPAENWPTSGAIEVQNFGASYSESSDLVLEGINITILPGEKLGICGRSGSGKSSLLASLFHLLEFREGSIKIDGQDMATMPRNALRERLNAIPQEPYWITTETVRFNLHPWNNTPPPDGQLIDALKKCQIWETIDEKGGLDIKMETELLSHGQRQLFCLARSLLRKSKVVILDEVSARYFEDFPRLFHANLLTLVSMFTPIQLSKQSSVRNLRGVLLYRLHTVSIPL